MGLFRISISEYSASPYEMARNFFKSRDTQRTRAEEFKRERDERNGATSSSNRRTANWSRNCKRLGKDSSKQSNATRSFWSSL